VTQSFCKLSLILSDKVIRWLQISVGLSIRFDETWFVGRWPLVVCWSKKEPSPASGHMVFHVKLVKCTIFKIYLLLGCWSSSWAE